VRVEEDDGHWLPPGAYLPALRRNRMTAKLDLWVLQQCLQAVAVNRELFEKYAGVSINLDSATIANDEFREQAAEMFANTPVLGSQICFELEEACVANQTAKVLALMEALKTHNVRFLLDHCRGSATIGLLRKVPVDFVKFHESLVRRALSDPLDRAELEWLVQAVHLLNRRAVASHVESKELRELMTKIGIDYMQGLAIDQLGPLLI
jgi:EAL domain-containing protein (putative c-di-GMP-specific phosphodiesterase class I)